MIGFGTGPGPVYVVTVATPLSSVLSEYRLVRPYAGLYESSLKVVVQRPNSALESVSPRPNLSQAASQCRTPPRSRDKKREESTSNPSYPQRALHTPFVHNFA